MTIQPGTGPSANGDGKPAPQPVYSSVEEWVTSHFLPMFRRPLGGEYRWCAQWWRHAEAITRLTALWHTWEALRLQPGTGMATWLRDHLDHHLPVLLGRTDPFPWELTEDDHRAILPRLHHAIAHLAVCIDGIAQATGHEYAKRQLAEGVGRLLSGCAHVNAAGAMLGLPGEEQDAEPAITPQPAQLSAADFPAVMTADVLQSATSPPEPAAAISPARTRTYSPQPGSSPAR